MSSQEPESLSNIPAEFARYARQIRFPGIGVDGQRRLADSQVLLVGCGALGSTIAETLVRAGVGKLRIVDRDFLELNNLQRQSLYDERDVAAGLPKAIAAKTKLSAINSSIVVDAVVADVTHENIGGLIDDVDLMLDGTDNFETRFLLNDVAVKYGLPWIFGGCLGCDGQSLTIIPGETACLNCVMLEGPPPPGTAPTCDSFGILAPIINVIASIQSIEAIKILSGNRDQISRQLAVISLWDTHLRLLDVSKLRDTVDCPTCQRNEFVWLSGQQGSHWAVLCGRNAVQLNLPDRHALDLGDLEKRLKTLGKVERNPFLLRLHVDEFSLTAFPDGRAIINGTEDIAMAKKLYTQYFGI